MNITKHMHRWMLVVPLLCAMALPATGQIPDTLSFQARTLDAAGNPINAALPMAVTVWTEETGGDLIFTQNVGLVVVEDGLYDFEWGGPGLYDALTNPACWFQVHIDGEALVPRERLVSVPYAQHAESANALTEEGIQVLVSNTVFAALAAGPNFTDESDGDLILTNEVMYVDVERQPVVVYNYRDVILAGTTQLIFTNGNTNGTTIIFNARNLTLTSFAVPMMDVTGLGAWGGSGGSYSGTANNVTQNGGNGRDGYGMAPLAAFGGTGSNGIGGTVTSLVIRPVVSEYAMLGTLTLPGGGGSGGRIIKGSDGRLFVGRGGDGGKGGGALLLLCEGDWNVTGSIWARGENGTNAQYLPGHVGSADNSVGGGGGGGGGSIFGLYGRLIANSGVHDVSGGTGGSGAREDRNDSVGGGGGSSIRANGGNRSAQTGGTGGAGSIVIDSARTIGR